jgi:uncharacterized protein YndB with AHSA1/START domain
VATNEVVTAAPPQAVFDVLSSAERYAQWVVGPRESGAPDGDWPARGSTFRHTEGRGPLAMQDETEIVEIVPPRRIVLDARIRPIAEARIELTLRSWDGGTRVRMVERVTGGPVGRIPRWLVDPVIYLRNRRALARLRRVVAHAHGSVQPR